jgi:hypothetical protein
MSKNSALTEVLKALLPYSRQNLLLSYSPNRFFNELERKSGYRQATLKAAFERGKKQKLITSEQRQPTLTSAGERKILPFIAKHLSSAGRLMVIFDIPEDMSYKRRQFRDLLKNWDFVQAQKSVWLTDIDYRDELIDVISELGIGRFVEVYESARLFPS